MTGYWSQKKEYLNGKESHSTWFLVISYWEKATQPTKYFRAKTLILSKLMGTLHKNYNRSTLTEIWGPRIYIWICYREGVVSI